MVGRIAEIVGREAPLLADYNIQMNLWKLVNRSTVDVTKTDYAFWDKLRFGKQKGYKMAGALCQPMTEIVSSKVIGETIKVACDHEYTREKLNDWLIQSKALVQTMVNDLYGLGDQHIIVNADGSLSVPSPDTVKLQHSLTDYRRIIRATLTTKTDHLIITDTYTDFVRTVVIKNISKEAITLDDGVTVILPDKEVQFEYQNLIGRIPIVHFANGRTANELYGRPIYEALLEIISQYDTLLMTSIGGAQVVANPLLVLNVDDTEQAIEDNQAADPDQYINQDGQVTDRRQIDIEIEPGAALTLGPGADAKFIAPAVGYTEDIRSLLKLLFLLILEHSRIPEAIWGGELTSSRSTASEQIDGFNDMITGKRTQLEGVGSSKDDQRGGLLELIDIWVRIQSLTDRQIKVMPVTITWAPLEKDTPEIHQSKVEFAHDRGIISKVETVRQLRLPGIDDEEAAVAAADEEMAASIDSFDTAVDADAAA